MTSPSENQEFSSSLEARNRSRNSPEDIIPEQIDLRQVYTLIDSVLPFEACLYYQVLPLFIKGSRLTIGLVNPEDLSATEYVRKQLSYINYSLAFKEIQSTWHRDLLSKYLNHNAKSSQPVAAQAEDNSLDISQEEWSLPSEAEKNNETQNTYIVDQPDEIADEALPSQVNYSGVSTGGLSGDLPTFVTDTSLPYRKAPRNSSPPSAQSDSPSSAAAPLNLQIDDQHLNAGESELASLPPKPLVQALLAKVLAEGIGRLYFERRSNAGRILWSKDGILQAVMESVDPQAFQGVINELKLMTHLSPIAAQKPQQVEIERLHEGQRILLRFRVMPSDDGEEATLQVLRGTALKFYQQQQLDKLGRDALDAAQRLQHRLQEIQERARQSLNLRPARSETLPAIVQLLRQIETQVQDLIAIYDPNE